MKTTTARRLSIAEAKSQLSRAVRDLGEGPAIIHNRGHDVAVLLRIEEYERLRDESSEEGGMPAFLRDVDELKQRHGGGVEFEPPRAALLPRGPFSRRRRP